MPEPPKAEDYDEAEAQRRFDEALKAGLKTPPKPLKEKARGPKPSRKGEK